MKAWWHSPWAWAGILVLSPLAYLGTMWIESALPQRTTSTAIPAPQAIAIARQFAESRQIHADSWEPVLGAKADSSLAALFRYRTTPALRQFIQPGSVFVLLRNGAGNHWIRTALTPDGQVVGFSIDRDKHRPNVDKDVARQTADAFRAQRLGADTPFQWTYVEPRHERDDSQERVFKWQAPVPGIPDATAHYNVETFGDQVVNETRSVTITGGLSARLHPLKPLVTTINAIGGTYMVLIAMFAIVPYIRRSRDKEVSHLRTLLTSLVFFLCAAVLTLDPGFAVAANNGDVSGSTRFQLLLGILLIAPVIGIAYGASEGGLRELYSGKITSLDSLLSGRLLSANVARAVLFGGAVAGILLFLQNVAIFAAHGLRNDSDSSILSGAYLKMPVMNLAWDRLSDAVVIATLGLLLPAIVLRPRIKSQAFYWLLGACALLTGCSTAADDASWITFLVSGSAVAAAVCFSFVYGDVLAAISSVFAMRFIGGLIGRSAVSPSWHHLFLANVAPIGIAFLAAEVYLAWRGRVYEEDEVRPRYARFLAEHMAMEAEIGAARLAQLRLLPAEPPRLEGLSIAASCVPAREVGGDFFDFFELSAGRLGVFVAEGGSRELASAMPIALAKGFLLYTAGLDISPADVLRRLGETVGSTLRGDSHMSVLYAVIDPRAGAIRFARTGDSPRVLINGKPAAEEVSAGVSHGAASLAPGDVLLFFTDGLTAQIAERKRLWTETFMQKLLHKKFGCPVEELRTALLHAAIRRKQHPADDVTAVLVRIEAARAMEGVA